MRWTVTRVRFTVRLHRVPERRDACLVRPDRYGLMANRVPVTSEVFAATSRVSSDVDA